jgi:hypothetical protein
MPCFDTGTFPLSSLAVLKPPKLIAGMAHGFFQVHNRMGVVFPQLEANKL